MNAARILYVTTPNIEEARTLANELLARNLIACANILPKMESIYRWNGKIETAQECVLILKTQSSLVEQTTKTIEDLHSYETPCVLEIPIESGSLTFLKWIEDSVKA